MHGVCLQTSFRRAVCVSAELVEEDAQLKPDPPQLPPRQPKAESRPQLPRRTKPVSTKNTCCESEPNEAEMLSNTDELYFFARLWFVREISSAFVHCRLTCTYNCGNHRQSVNGCKIWGFRSILPNSSKTDGIRSISCLK